MPVYKTEGIVIRRTNLGEADRIVTLFTPDHGKIAAAARGARRPGSRFAGRLELFTHLRALLAHGRTLDVISQVEVIDPFAAIRGDLGRMGAASFVAEVTDRATPEREGQRSIYAALRHALRLVASGDAQLAAMWYGAQVLALSGYAPVVERCVVCGKPLRGGAAFSPALGGALCATDRARDAGAVPASAVALAAIGFLLEAPAGALRRIRVDRRQRAEVEALLRRDLEYRLEARLKSPPVIERISRLGAEGTR